MTSQESRGERVDERDTLFSRIRLRPGSTRYREYYLRNPGKKAIDDGFRNATGGKFSDRLPEAPMVEATFGLITQLRAFVRGYEGEYRYGSRRRGGESEAGYPVEAEEERQDSGGLTERELTALLKQQAGRYGAVRSEAVEMDRSFSYSVRGRGARYGEAVDRLLPNAFVIAMQMDKEEIAAAPAVREAVEVAGTYLRAAVPALVIAAYLRSLGYEAVAHMDGESEVVMPPLAQKAGLGKIGRHGLIVSKTYGSLLRFSAVTTDAPLELYTGGAEDFPLEKACEACGKCGDFCPSGAIPTGSIIGDWENAIRRVDHEECFRMWFEFGTDCGVCLAVCPYSRAAPGVGGDKSDGPRPGSPDFLKNYMFGSGKGSGD